MSNIQFMYNFVSANDSISNKDHQNVAKALETNYFEILIDKEFRYEKEVVENDDEFLLFEVENDIVTYIKAL